MSIDFPQDPRYADSGRRTIEIAGRKVGAACAPLRSEDASRFKGTHEIVLGRVSTVRPGTIVSFDGRDYRVITAMDPRANDPDTRGRYLRLICEALEEAGS